jgi:hypothetical protein
VMPKGLKDTFLERVTREKVTHLTRAP